MKKQLIEAIDSLLDANIYESEILSMNNVNNVVDKNAAKTDVNNKSLPTDKVEFGVSINDLIDANPDANLGDIYQQLKKEFEDDDTMPKSKVNEASDLFVTVSGLKKLALQTNTPMSDILDMVQSHPDFDLANLQKVIATKKGNMKKTVETIIRENVNNILNELLPQKKRLRPGDYRDAKPPTPEELADLRKMLDRVKVDDDEKTGYEPKKTIGKGDEQAGQILAALRDTFGIDMSQSQFSNFDKATKMRWFCTAVLSDKDPMFLERTVKEYVSELEDSAKETGVLDKELEAELLELEDLLIADPSGSEAFMEYLQQEVQNWVETLSDDQWKEIVDRANDFFSGIPGGLLKRNREGVVDYEFLRQMMRRRQDSKNFSGAGDLKSGGGSSFDRFKAGIEHPKFPPEE